MREVWREFSKVWGLMSLAFLLIGLAHFSNFLNKDHVHLNLEVTSENTKD